jgi:pilus assembly protein Flp/PilA
MKQLQNAIGRVALMVGGLTRSSIEREEGQALVEYGLILALIAVVCAGVLTTLGTDIKAEFSSIITSL